MTRASQTHTITDGARGKASSLRPARCRRASVPSHVSSRPARGEPAPLSRAHRLAPAGCLCVFPHWLREGDPTHASAHSRSRAPVRVGTRAPFHASVCLLRWSQFLGRPVAGRATVLFSNAAARAPTAGGGGTLSAPRCPRLAPELPKNLLFWGHPISLFLRVL